MIPVAYSYRFSKFSLPGIKRIASQSKVEAKDVTIVKKINVNVVTNQPAYITGQTK